MFWIGVESKSRKKKENLVEFAGVSGAASAELRWCFPGRRVQRETKTVSSDTTMGQ
ncbi:hypothetical protein A2U01_0012934 [Trifolium medium]|uniref:Uncharacterized protein n=1 Tax=Trifolium medium TaxID=97028 RepID=A0A392MXG5_9FABA|nr:hypothetical protein [Trifolium medium]